MLRNVVFLEKPNKLSSTATVKFSLLFTIKTQIRSLLIRAKRISIWRPFRSLCSEMSSMAPASTRIGSLTKLTLIRSEKMLRESKRLTLCLIPMKHYLLNLFKLSMSKLNTNKAAKTPLSIQKTLTICPFSRVQKRSISRTQIWIHPSVMMSPRMIGRHQRSRCKLKLRWCKNNSRPSKTQLL